MAIRALCSKVAYLVDGTYSQRTVHREVGVATSRGN